jgi:hypothetical protein
MTGVVSAGLAVAIAGTALAASDSVTIQAPGRVAKGKVLHTTILGSTGGARHLAYFAAYEKCAANAVKEMPISVGYIFYDVNGSFSHRVATPPLTKAGHLCAYIQKGGAKRIQGVNIPNGPVTFKASKSYKLK